MRQYIGARYVPKFMGVYDVTQVYEALSVVDNGQGTSYISKIPTPAGTPLTDTNYWTLYGSASGAIIQIQQEIADMKDGTVVGSLQNQIDTLDTSVSGIASDVATKETSIENRNILFIGDSYDTIVPTYKWTEIAATKMGVTNYTIRSAGGYGFDPVSGYTWKNYLIANPVSDANAITDIVIGGGTNDSTQTEANLKTAISDFNDYIEATFPNCKRVYLGYMGWSHLNATQKGQHRNTMITYLESAKALGWRFLNGVQYVLRDPSLILSGLADKVHPNADGVTQLGECVAMAIMDGYAEIRHIFATAFTPNSAKVSGNDISVGQNIYNGNMTVTFPDTTLTATDTLSSYFTLASSPDLSSAINQYQYWQTYVAFSGNIYPCVLVSLNPNELTLWLRGGVTIPSGTSFQVGTITVTDCT